ncbi:uncharacterized protein MELLADRAFT_74980 [Melampsora larici-populina 98AG31]|uniref:Uncharacterized protein n=1 Tax=Melampsora larici-populina (strain 98AG31 / pathotype 3-4-7) TaxID=747676 RepID=F4RPM9_MELLP|nr:uncharacterized protein MELLADRAFT_74980 [Melampsora larici-populina 98AG31]EGG05565.1 hypothetical protein MELLADRAFT_74980 [Melampsora larici-populina 98AG31]
MYIVIASKVSPTTGSKEYDVGVKSDKLGREDAKLQLSKNKPVKFTPRSLNAQFKSPLITTDSESVQSLRFGPSDYGPSSFSSASNDVAAGPSDSSPNTAVSDTIPNPSSKKRTRAPPKRNTKRGRALDLTIAE